MNFNHTQWSIKQLLDAHKSNSLNLAPNYQRNFIWSSRDQQDLIDSIKRGFPLPTIFLYERDPNKYEVVDGQQRCRTIINYFNENQSNIENTPEGKQFLEYELPITILVKVDEDDIIEVFYTKVNKSGLKLNNPELKKGEFFDTKFLKLNESLAGFKDFQDLGLFTNSSVNRMNDVDLVSELTTYLISGVITDKKETVDKTYEKDINDSQVQTTTKSFEKIIKTLTLLDKKFPINKTRFKQRNDFYTLFQFINENPQLSSSDYKYIYDILLVIAQYISPADSACLPLKEYARNCITQSNSKAARLKRYAILKSILLGDGTKQSKEQKQIQEYFELGSVCMIIKNPSTAKAYTTFDIKKLNGLK
ncbi:DUF262 domain-containing protein [Hymenobacter sp. BT507]|uniref:DUF262 domain-containing protein n=1 Tax=Hymenobacter citatus TaxID=2763506 RepID=A0ABR7MIQ6_9BACT|nr:DUF262 domain-containing protein [Hymenobacter citatus]MBC6610958.1 DUF262 domain-containing protein [Hymenobacter citatus]